jgi:2-polyprenyl-3-methyl-5-hydroxy-6-metoxy-1,4-benzoquinol methylase
MNIPIHGQDKPAASELLVHNTEVLLCPVCSGSLHFAAESISCSGCNRNFCIDHGIPLLFWMHDWPADKSDVTETMKSFYETTPFPNYDQTDSAETLKEKAVKGLFARLIDEQIPFGSAVLEVGCGTGQLSNFLGTTWGRTVLATDACLNSLKLAEGFRKANRIKNVAFLQMNLFRPVFKPEIFDIVICNGVLHHTSDPFLGFQTIAKLLKPGGVILIGLYNKYSRVVTDAVRFGLRISGDRLRFLDPRLRQKDADKVRQHTWFLDRFKNPHESKHTIAEVQHWFEVSGFEFLNSIPKANGARFLASEKLFEPHPKGTKAEQVFVQMRDLLSGGRDGGLFVMIGRKAK